MKTIFFFLQGSRLPLELQGKDEISLSELLKDHFDISQEQKFTVYDFNSDDELPIKNSLRELGLKHNHRLVVSKCKKVDVKVHYAGQIFNDSFNPHNKIEKVLKKSLDHFSINHDEYESFELYLSPNSKEPLSRDLPIIVFVGQSACSIDFYLSKPVNYNG